MQVYLDMCSIQRPLDTKSQVRVAVEAEAVLGILDLIEVGLVQLVASDALFFEAERNPQPVRRRYTLDVLAKAKVFVRTDAAVEKRARSLLAEGIKPLDALHLASAEAAKADFMCTCDDRFLKRAKALRPDVTKAVSPLELIMEIGS
jgi:predicted nucleic acid-binding protein